MPAKKPSREGRNGKDDSPVLIEPGDKFYVEYGNGKKVQVVALAGRKQRLLADKIRQLVELEQQGKGLELFALSEEALQLAMGGGTDEDCSDSETSSQKQKRKEANRKSEKLFATDVDAEMAIDIATKTMGKQYVGTVQKKR